MYAGNQLSQPELYQYEGNYFCYNFSFQEQIFLT